MEEADASTRRNDIGTEPQPQPLARQGQRIMHHDIQNIILIGVGL